MLRIDPDELCLKTPFPSPNMKLSTTALIDAQLCAVRRIREELESADMKSVWMACSAPQYFTFSSRTTIKATSELEADVTVDDSKLESPIASRAI